MKYIQKTINHQHKISAEKYEAVYNSFKKLYFDIRVVLRTKETKTSFSVLNNDSLKRSGVTHLLKYNFMKYNNVDYSEIDSLLDRSQNKDYSIIADTQLQDFLKTAGHNLNKKEIEFMLHMIETYETYNNERINLLQLYEIWGAMVHFSMKRPEEIIYYVFAHYLDGINLECIQKINYITKAHLEDFFERYKEYFEEEQRNFILEEVNYLGKEFSVETFIMYIVGPRRYYPK